jgi:hypothetical protein
MTILNAFLMHKSCGGKKWHKKIREILVSEFIIHSKEENFTATGTSLGKPRSTASQLCRLEGKHFHHWPAKGKKRRCRLCSLQKKKKGKLCVSARSVTWVCVSFCASRYGTRTLTYVIRHYTHPIETV